MKKILLVVLILIFVFSLNIFRNNIFASNIIPTATTEPQISSFELFWPVVAGKVRGDSLYSLKLLKEKIRSLFIFSSLKKAEYYSFLSTKRLVEFEDLILEKKDFKNAELTQKDILTIHQNMVLIANQAKKEELDVIGTLQKISDTFDKQLSLLEEILTKVNEQQKPLVNNIILSIKSLSF